MVAVVSLIMPEEVATWIDYLFDNAGGLGGGDGLFGPNPGQGGGEANLFGN